MLQHRAALSSQPQAAHLSSQPSALKGKAAGALVPKEKGKPPATSGVIAKPTASASLSKSTPSIAGVASLSSAASAKPAPPMSLALKAERQRPDEFEMRSPEVALSLHSARDSARASNAPALSSNTAVASSSAASMASAGIYHAFARPGSARPVMRPLSATPQPPQQHTPSSSPPALPLARPPSAGGVVRPSSAAQRSARAGAGAESAGVFSNGKGMRSNRSTGFV